MLHAYLWKILYTHVMLHAYPLKNFIYACNVTCLPFEKFYIRM